MITPGPKIKDFHIIAVKRKSPRLIRQMPAKIFSIFAKLHFAMGIALEFLKGNDIIPDKGYLLTILSADNLGEIAPGFIPSGLKNITY